MVDCGNSTCVQERRLLKKELLTWTKKVPLLIGLEEVAKEVLGRRRSRKIFGPLLCLESSEVHDWEPISECSFCDSTKQTSTDVGSQTVGQEHGCIAGENTGVKYRDLQQLLPLSYPPSIVRNHAPATSTASTTTVPASASTTLSHGDEGNHPLDLSASARKGTASRSETDSPTRAALELKVPLIQSKMGKRKEQHVKKQYTEDELVSAVNHIRSGKIGTRRASSIYGIPRSTLRNKIFRMDAEEPYYYENRLSMCDLLQNGDLMADQATNRDRESSSSGFGFDFSPEDWQHKLEQVRRKHDLNAGLERPFGMPPLFFNSLHMMECEKAFSMSNPYAYELKLPFLHELVRKFAEQRMEYDRQHGASANALLTDLVLSRNSRMNSLSHTPDLSSVELKIPSYKPMKNYTNGVASDSLAGASSLHCESNPTPSTSSKIGDTLKDIIAKSIADRVRSRTQVAHPSLHATTVSDLARATPPEQSSTGEDSERDEQPPKKPRWDHKREGREGSQPLSDSERKQSGSDSEQRQKKTRPKRGQYRKYNNELLLEAVRAVQRGEMSVHRAGSYFGVPHSTLEYKVKERHLLRQKKPREGRKKQTTSTATTTTAATTSTATTTSPDSPSDSSGTSNKRPDSPPANNTSAATSTCSDRSNPAQENLFPKSSTSSSLLLSGGSPGPSSPFSVASPLPLSFGWPPIMNGTVPFGVHSPTMAAYGPNFTINTSASDLLKKLQKKVQAKTGFGKLLENEVNGAMHDGSG